MKLSIKHSPIGKPEKDQFDFKNWTYGWLAVDFSPRELASHLELGKPFAIGHDAHKSHKVANFALTSSTIEPTKKAEITLLVSSKIPLMLRLIVHKDIEVNSNAKVRNLKLRGFLGGAAQFMAGVILPVRISQMRNKLSNF